MFYFSVLSIAPGDEDALRCKVVALIRADSFDKALSTIQSCQKFSTDFGFFKVRFEHLSSFFGYLKLLIKIDYYMGENY